MRRSPAHTRSPTGEDQENSPRIGSWTGNLIGKRLRYALSVRGFARRTALSDINDQIKAIAPDATTLSEAALSRISNGKRSVKDYELLAIARAIDVTPGWLLGDGSSTPLQREPQ